MSIHYTTVFRKNTGEIVGTGMFSCLEEMVEMNFAARLGMYGEIEHSILDIAANPEIHYITMMEDKPVLSERPQIPYHIDKTTIVAGNDDFLTITGLHDPCELTIDDPDELTETTTATVTGGAFEFSAETPGTYTIQMSRFPFLPLTLEITAIPAEASATSEFVTDFSYEFGS